MKYPLNIFLVVVSLTCFNCSNEKREYYQNGMLKSSFIMEDGVLNGYYREYYENGLIMWEGNYKNGLLNGTKRIFYENSGRVEWIGNYKNGKLNGLYQYFSKDGILLEQVNYKNGKQDGLSKFYYPNGAIEIESMFKDGIAEGIYKEYFMNGEIRLTGFCIDDELKYCQKFNNKGELVDELWEIDIYPKTDTIIRVGSTYLAEIKIWGDLPKYVSVKAGIFDSILLYPSPLEIMPHVKVENGIAKYSYVPDDTGTYYLNIHALLSDSININRFFQETSKIRVLPNNDSINNLPN